MRFGQSRTNDPLRNPQSQRKLFVQVMLLGFMLIAVQWAAKARNWTWLVPEKTPQTAADVPLKQLDFKVKSTTGKPLADGEVRIAETPPSVTQAPLVSKVESQLPSELLSVMDDGRLGTLRAEQTVIDQLIDQVRTLDAGELARVARRDVGFVELNDRPADHRGQLLGYSGTLWRLSQTDGLDTPESGDDLYEAWIMTPDAANNPTRLLLTEVPAGITPGNLIDKPVQFAGYFLKRYGYATERGTHIAPLLVGRTMTIQSPSPATRQLHREQNWGQWLGGLVVAGFATLLLLKRLSREMTPPRRRVLPETIPPTELVPSTELGGSSDPDQ